MFKFLKSLLSGPQPSGPPVRIDLLKAETSLISDLASWVDGAIVVTTAGKDTIRLVEFELKNVEQCMLGLKFMLSSSDVEGGAYPEMWMTVDGFGECFSKGMNSRVKGSNDWTSCELPFLLKKNQRGTLLKFNVVFEGPGSVAIKNVELFLTPLE